MSKLLEVKEFDLITDNIVFRDNIKYKYLTNKKFKILIDFIENFQIQESNDVVEFMNISSKRNVGKVVSIRNYVGLIQVANGLQIQVLPKICFPSNKDNENEETKRVFIKMIKSMKDFPSKVFSDTNLKIKKMSLYEIFISMYIQEVRQLVKRGIKSAYISHEVHKQRFYVAYDEFHPNRPENKLIKATLLKLLHVTQSSKNAKDIKQLLIAFEMVEPSINYNKDFFRVKIDRNTKNYEIIIQWSKVFLLNKSFTTFSGENLSKSLLFPMEKVFESYVALHIKRIFGDKGWSVVCQDKRYYLFTEPRYQFALRPDIVCKKGERTIILDTKWKNLVNDERKNYGILQADMYQMYAYSKKYKTSEIWLLYPLNNEMRNHKEIIFDSGDETVVRVHFIDVVNIEKSLKELNEKIES